MRKLKMTIGILTMTLATLTAMSCKDGKKDGATAPMSSEMHQEDAGSEVMADNSSNSATNTIIDNYLQIKNALVTDDQEAAAKAGGDLFGDFEDFDKSSYSSEEHAEHISESPIEHQREHFDILSKDVIDMIAITGTDKKLYQDFCPMYNGNKGAQWLSTTEEIKNPYMGSKMPGCGKVQKEIN